MASIENKVENSYGGEQIQVLEGLEPVRVRPGMYIGSTGPRGLHHLVYEIVDNSIDEALAGYCDHIEVDILPGNAIRVADNGRGIPVGIQPSTGLPAVTVVFTVLHAGGKFGGENSGYKVSGGLHGVGVSCVNALSVWMEATVKRDGHIYQQKYEKGIPKTKVEVIGDIDSSVHGTTIRWKADPSIFTVTTTYDWDILIQRLKELAFLNSGITIIFRDERLENPKEEILKYEGGIVHYVAEINSKAKFKYPEEPIYITGEKDDVITELSFQYNESYSENIHTYVNDIRTTDGGTHLDGFKSALLFVISKFLDSNEKIKKRMPKKEGKLDPKDDPYEKINGDDVKAGLVAVLSMKVPEPEFVGQTKDKLGNPEVRGIVDSLVKEKLTIFFEQNPHVVEKVLEKAVAEATARIAARKAKDASRKKSGLTGFKKPEKLADCSIKDNPEICEVYIVEGDSAGGSAKDGRDAKTQAILPLWGKMLNVEKVSADKVMNNEKLEPVINTLGTGFGKDFNIEKLRYHKIIIMADADVDGSHIRTLLLTFFFRYMRPLITNGNIYIAQPPLFKVSKKKGKREIAKYAFSDEERDMYISELSAEGDGKLNVQRYKGLGEMDPEQLWETTMNPETRTMLRVTVEDAAKADEIMTVLMGDKVEPRREFIEQNATLVQNLDF